MLARWLLMSTAHFGDRQGLPVSLPDADPFVLKSWLWDHLPPAEIYPRAHAGSQSPATMSGRVLRALAAHDRINSVLVYFGGYPGPNGVFSVALGLRDKYIRTGVRGWVATAEYDDKAANESLAYLRLYGLERYVRMYRQPVPPAVPVGPIDMLAEDMDGGTPLEVIDAALEKHKPWIMVSDETHGIGGNHAFKRDYQHMMPRRDIVVKNRPSEFSGITGRAFSVYTHPRQYRHIGTEYRAAHDKRPCPKIDAGGYIGWGVTTQKLARKHNTTEWCAWHAVTCAAHTLCKYEL